MVDTPERAFHDFKGLRPKGEEKLLVLIAFLNRQTSLLEKSNRTILVARSRAEWAEEQIRALDRGEDS